MRAKKTLVDKTFSFCRDPVSPWHLSASSNIGNMGDGTAPQKICAPQFTIQPMQRKGSTLCGLFYYQERDPILCFAYEPPNHRRPAPVLLHTATICPVMWLAILGSTIGAQNTHIETYSQIEITHLIIFIKQISHNIIMSRPLWEFWMQ
jgi:hypothetical protein